MDDRIKKVVLSSNALTTLNVEALAIHQMSINGEVYVDHRFGAPVSRF